jgi:hypothetical protein
MFVDPLFIAKVAITFIGLIIIIILLLGRITRNYLKYWNNKLDKRNES